MHRKAAIVLVLVAGSVSAVWAYARGRGNESLQLSGSIESRQVQVGSLVGGRVASVLVEEGDTVRRGQALVTIEPDLIELQVREQEARVGEARAVLLRLERGPRAETIARARVDWEGAERERARLETLLAGQLVSQQQYDGQATAAATRLETLRELQKGSRAEDIAAARAAVEREAGRLAYLKRQQLETVVKAPCDGRIESLDLRPGDLVAASQPVASLLEASQQWARVYVPETRLGLLRVGQPATVTVDAYPNRRFTGRVSVIDSHAEYMPRNVQTLDQRNDQVFAVKVTPDPDPALKPGMAVLVTLPVR